VLKGGAGFIKEEQLHLLPRRRGALLVGSPARVEQSIKDLQRNHESIELPCSAITATFGVRRQSAGVPSAAAALGWQRCGDGALDFFDAPWREKQFHAKAQDAKRKEPLATRSHL
jgi:hypothetical protein